jgi:hypothetical protein
VQWCIACGILRFDQRPVHKQHLHDLQVTRRAGFVQCGFAAVVHRVHLGLLTEQVGCSTDLTLRSRNVQRSAAGRIAKIDIKIFASKEELQRIHATKRCTNMQYTLSVLVHTVYIDTGRDYFSDPRDLIECAQPKEFCLHAVQVVERMCQLSIEKNE